MRRSRFGSFRKRRIRSISKLNRVTQTTMNSDTSDFVWERFTTIGIPRDSLHYSAFVCHYHINRLPRARYGAPTSLLPYYRNSDWVRCTGIHIKLDIVLNPKSAFKLRVILFQSPYSMEHITDNDLEDNGADAPNDDCMTGCYTPNGTMFTELHRNPENGNPETAIAAPYKPLFKNQRKGMEHLDFNKVISKIKITHPFVKVLYDGHLSYFNKKLNSKNFTYNYFHRSNTTWKYEPTVHDDRVTYESDYIPDRKVFVMILATPVYGSVEDTGQPMHGVEMDGPVNPPVTYQFNEDQRDTLVQHREGTIELGLDSKFGPAIKKETLDAVDVGKGKGSVTTTGGVITRSKSKSQQPLDFDDPDGGDGGESGTTDENNQPDDIQFNLDQEEDAVRYMVRAMRINRSIARNEARDRREANPPPPPRSKTPKPDKPHKERLETNQYGWAFDQTILIRPTIELWYKNMTGGRFNR
jgi:hypothetical protein